MGRMVRKQVYIESDQDAFLKRRARELRVTEAELIRRAIESFAEQSDRGPTPEEAWAEELAFIEERAKLVAPKSTTGRGWTREELYDERPKRYSR